MSNKLYRKDDLYIFELSRPVLSSLELIVFDGTLREVQPKVVTTPQSVNNTNTKKVEERSDGKYLYCNACEISFNDQDNKREHHKVDFHRFNVKRTLNNLPPVGEDDFLKLIQELKTDQNENEHPTSDNASSDDDASVDDESSETKRKNDTPVDEIYHRNGDYLGTLIEEELKNLSMNDLGVSVDDQDTSISHLNTRSAQIFFKSNLLPTSEAFGVYKALFTKSSIEKPLHIVNSWNNGEDHSMEISALFMIGGGHFAGAIVSHQRTTVHGNARKQDESLQEQAVAFLEHKTFHRYTTRRKQGGSQSAMDQSKGKANSAGSSLRRYNEAALKIDVQSILKEWGPYLDKCQNVFLRANSSAEKKIFTENALISKLGDRVKNYPFTTGRPTINELKRCWCELTYIKALPIPTPLPLKKTPPLNDGGAQKFDETKKSMTFSKSPEESHTEELLSLLKKGRAPLLIAYLRKHNLSPNFRLMPEAQYQNTPTMLHYAAQNNLKQMIAILLTNMKCDPCIKNRLGKTAWDLTKDIQVKQSFQIARYKLGEDFANWVESHIAEPLSREQVDEMNKEEAERHNSDLRAAIEKELKNVKEKQKVEAAAKSGSKTLDGRTIVTSPNLNSLTDEQRRKLMREQRARAAEARMRKR